MAEVLIDQDKFLAFLNMLAPEDPKKSKTASNIPNNERIDFTLPGETKEAFRHIVKRRGLNFSSACRLLVEDCVRKNGEGFEQLYTAAR